ADLDKIGSRLKLPDGWKSRIKTLEEDLILIPESGVARIVADNLDDVYDVRARATAVTSRDRCRAECRKKSLRSDPADERDEHGQQADRGKAELALLDGRAANELIPADRARQVRPCL